MNKGRTLPAHIAIIMDGNGRWAKRRGLPRSEGHKQGGRAFRKICEYAADIGVRYITFYAFSTENWARPADEVAVIMELFREYLFEAKDRKEENRQKGFRIRFIGDTSRLPEDIRALAAQIEKESEKEVKTTVNLAVNYGGRQEILRAAALLADSAKRGEIQPGEITLVDIESRLYTAGQPAPDLIIRPSGEYRLSNFLVWQSAYSEFWFTDVLWPDFTTADLDAAIEDYNKRERRYGGLG
mgnify:CR=1 FL=1